MQVERVTIVCDLHDLIGEEVEGKTRTIRVDGRKATKRDLCDACNDEYGLLLKVLAARRQ